MHKTSFNVENRLLSRHIAFKSEGLRFTGEPVTRRTRPSHDNVIHVRTWKNSLRCHPTSCHIQLYHDSRRNPNANTKTEHDVRGTSQSVMIGLRARPLTKLLMGFKSTAIFC